MSCGQSLNNCATVSFFGDFLGSFSFSFESVGCAGLGCLFGPPAPFEQIELGEAFEFNASAFANATTFGLPCFGLGSAVASGGYTFEFFEDDGTTPVAVSELPKPGPISLLAIDLLALLCWASRKAVAWQSRPCKKVAPYRRH